MSKTFLTFSFLIFSFGVAGEKTKTACHGVAKNGLKLVLLATTSRGSEENSMNYQVRDKYGNIFLGSEENVNPKEIEELRRSEKRFNLEFYHHNTGLKVSSDGEIFPSDPNSDESVEGEWAGKAVLSYRSDVNVETQIFDVICRDPS